MQQTVWLMIVGRPSRPESQFDNQQQESKLTMVFESEYLERQSSISKI